MFKLENYFRLDKVDGLSLNEYLVYAVIARNSYRCKSKISRAKIAQLCGIKKLDNISKYTSKLETLGLIKKEVVQHRADLRTITYLKTEKKGTPYMLVTNNFMDEFLPNLPNKSVALAFDMAKLRYRDTSTIWLDDEELLVKLCIKDMRTFKKYITPLLENGVVVKIDGGYVLNTQYFPVNKHFTKQASEYIKIALGMDHNSRAYKAVHKAIATNFENIYDIENWLFAILNGKAFLTDKEKENLSNKEICTTKEFEF